MGPITTRKGLPMVPECPLRHKKRASEDLWGDKVT